MTDTDSGQDHAGLVESHPEHVRFMTQLRLVSLATDRLRQNLAADLNVSVSEVVALQYLFHERPLTLRELCERMNLASGTMTALVDRLERRGFAQRQQNPSDRRSYLVHISDVGRTHISRNFDRFLSSAEVALTPLTPQTLDGISDVFDTMITEINASVDRTQDADRVSTRAV